MPTATVKIRSLSPYSQSRVTPAPGKGVDKDEHERETWRLRIHQNDAGHVVIPAAAFKSALMDAAQFLGTKIPGQKNATYTKHFRAGVMVLEDLDLGIKAEKVEGEWLFMNSDGVRNGGKRVMRCFPVIPAWSGEVTFHIFSPTITKDVFEDMLKAAGLFIGIGRWRPQNGGTKGRFTFDEVKWEK